jgi:hypothetical protein
MVHLVAYHPRRTLQPIQHVDQSWTTSGLSIRVLSEGKPFERAYLAPQGEELAFRTEDGYALVDLPPIQAHLVLVLE